MSNEHIGLLREARPAWLYPIYVPSYTRAGKAPLLELLARAQRVVQLKVHIVVRSEELAEYRQAYPWAAFTVVRRVGLGPARTQALKNARRLGYERIVMMDDDIKHVSLLERPEGSTHTRRYSSKVAGIPEPGLLVRSLAVACKLADGVFATRPDAVYGACRNALFSGDVRTDIGATLNRGTFPASVMFYDLERMENYELPPRFHLHGEDVAFAMDVMTRGQEWFTIPVAAFDQDGNIETTIPLDPHDSVARRVDIENAALDYPDIHPFLRESVRNKAGGVMRVGVNWNRWYKATGSGPVDLPLTDIIKES